MKNFKQIYYIVSMLFIISILTSASISSAEIETPKSLTIASDVWENITNENNTGLIFDLADLIYKSNKILPKIKLTTYDESIKAVKQKKVDAAVGVYLNEQTGVIYPKFFYSQDDITACYKKNKFSIKNDKGLEEKKIGFVKGYGFDKYLSVKVNITENIERKELVDLLVNDKIDFYLDAIADINKTFADNKINKSDYEFVNLKILNLYIVFADNENGKYLAKVWDTEFKKALINNSLAPIYKKWKNATLMGMTK